MSRRPLHGGRRGPERARGRIGGGAQPFNFRPKGVVSHDSRRDPERFLAELARGRRLVLKVFPGHTRAPLPPHCAVVLERTNVAGAACTTPGAPTSGRGGSGATARISRCLRRSSGRTGRGMRPSERTRTSTSPLTTWCTNATARCAGWVSTVEKVCNTSIHLTKAPTRSCARLRLSRCRIFELGIGRPFLATCWARCARTSRRR